MSFHLRPYQAQAVSQVREKWTAGYKNVALRLPTGGGKTPTFGSIIAAETAPSIAIAHRSELVGQMSLALARYGVRHRVIGPSTLHRDCVSIHMAELGRNYCDPNAPAAVAGIDTLIRRDLGGWADSVGLWVVDEGHHLLRSNKWGKGVALFRNARGLLVTATLNRPDGKGLGVAAEGVADALVQGPELVELQGMGYLTPAKIYSVPSDISVAGISISADGDLNQVEMRKAVHRSKKIVGDIVQHYQLYTPGKLGITFCADIEACHEVVTAFRAAGVTCEIVTGEDHPVERASKMRRFRARQIMMLVNVDVLGEGVDVPAVEVVIMARPTSSYSVFAQQAGRMLRLMLAPQLAAAWDTFTDAQRRDFIAQSGKPFGVLIDHVGNVAQHAVARDCPMTGKLVIDLCCRDWTLQSREKALRGVPEDVVPLRTCTAKNEETGVICGNPYARTWSKCDKCGARAPVLGRSTPEQVDGRLEELSPEALKALADAVRRVDGAPPRMTHLGVSAQLAVFNNHTYRQQAQAKLRDAMMLWGGKFRSPGIEPGMQDPEAQSRFFLTHKIDVLSAMALGVGEATELEQRLRKTL